MIHPYDAWVLRRLLIGESLNGEIESVSEPYRRLVDYMSTEGVEARRGVFDGFLCGRDDLDEIIDAVSAADPSGPAPEVEISSAQYATLADIARIVTAQPWLWRGWIASGVLNAVAAEPGTGKTRFGLDLARRLWFRFPWPDGQENTLPKGTRTLWVQGDRNFAEMLQAARDFGLPDEAVVLGSSPDDPTGGLDLDDFETMAAPGDRIQAARAALVLIDTVGMTTARNLCRPEEARAFFAPLMELAGKTGVAIIGQTHLSQNNNDPTQG